MYDNFHGYGSGAGAALVFGPRARMKGSGSAFLQYPVHIASADHFIDIPASGPPGLPFQFPDNEPGRHFCWCFFVDLTGSNKRERSLNKYP